MNTPGPGRPSKFTEYTKARILASLKAGNYRATACDVAGISYQTFCQWMNDKRPSHTEFRDAVIRAEAEAEEEVVRFLHSSALSDPKVAIDYLSRKYPERWAAQSRIEITELLRREARSMAAEYPELDEDELIAEAEAILTRNT